MCLPQFLTRSKKILTSDWQKSCVFQFRILQVYPPPSAPSYVRNEHSSKFVHVVFVMDFWMAQIYTKFLLSSFWHESYNVPSTPSCTLWTWSGTRAVQGRNPVRNIQVQKRLVDSEQLHTIVYQDFCKELTKLAYRRLQDGFQQVAHGSGSARRLKVVFAEAAAPGEAGPGQRGGREGAEGDTKRAQGGQRGTQGGHKEGREGAERDTRRAQEGQRGTQGGHRAVLTLVDGVLGQLAQLAVHHPCIRTQELLLAGRQLRAQRLSANRTHGLQAPAPRERHHSSPCSTRHHLNHPWFVQPDHQQGHSSEMGHHELVSRFSVTLKQPLYLALFPIMKIFKSFIYLW